jgi:hypothetical protein
MINIVLTRGKKKEGKVLVRVTNLLRKTESGGSGEKRVD